MNRRSFLALFGAAAAGLLVGDYDPSRLTWLAPAADAAGTPIVTMPEPGTLLIDPTTSIVRPMPAAMFSLKQQAELVAREIWRRLGSPTDLHRIPNVHRPGDTGRIRVVRPFIVRPWDPDEDITCELKPVVMEQGAFIRTEMSPERHLRDLRGDDAQLRRWVHDAYVLPMAAQLAQYIESGGINAFASDLDLPCSADEAVCVTDKRSGITIRGIRYFNLPRCQHETSFDFLGGRV